MQKCLTWSLSGLLFRFSLPFGFCYPFDGIRVLNVLFGFVSFSSSFLQATSNKSMFGTSKHSQGWGMFKFFWYLFSMFRPKVVLFIVFLSPFSSFQHQLVAFGLVLMGIFGRLLGPSFKKCP